MVLNRAVGQLARFLGADKAQEMVRSCLREAGLQDLATPQDLLAFANLLIAKGGLIEVVGRSLKAQALQGGASVA